MADKKKPEGAQPDAAPEAAAAERTLLEQIIFEGKVARDEKNTEQVKYAKEMVGEFVNQILGEHIQSAPDSDKVKLIQERIAQIDELLTGYLNEIMHDEGFQRLEASWRGLHYLVSNTETSTTLKLRLLNATKKEVLDDLKRAVEFDQSIQFKQLYEEEYGTFGGHPYSVLIGDY
ncbi:MAG TPA: type VI secretion system contractile sheath large subunit, partial [Pyrinomonadaceae bacterium]|nr:type VI secretion system contractile sheath large subunit [Pyrinomonadaceae bacterium]